MRQAIQIGYEMNAKHIILTHFSARYGKIPMLPDYLEGLGNISIAMDHMVVRYGHLPVLPKLIPLFRELFKEDLLELNAKSGQCDEL